MSGLYSFFAETAADHPERPVLCTDGESVTYEEAIAEIDRRAALLRELGIGADDRVATLLPTDPELVYLLFGAAKVGATCVPLDYRQAADAIEYLVGDADPSVLVVDQAAADAYADASDEVDVETVLTHDVPYASARDLDAAVETVGTAGERADVDPDDIAVLNYTSGTTGPPKGVRNPHRSFAEAGERAADFCHTDADDRALLVLPLFHANPLTYGLMQMVAVGGSVALVREFSASEFWETARTLEATFFTHVGSVLEILSRTYREGDYNPETPLEFAMGGAAHFDEESQRWFERTFGIQVIRLYGMSELGAGLVTLCERVPGEDHAPTHQGRVQPAPFDVRILEEDGLSFADHGETGEIVVRPDRPATMFRGYRNETEETVADWRDLWMHTGDLGRIKDGTLRYLGRMATSIRKGGENVSPWEIESVVERFDEVTAAVAVGVPDETLGKAINLYVVPDDPELDEATVHDRCRSELADHLVPRYVTFVQSIPRTSTEKVERAELSDRRTDDAWDARER